MLEERDFKTADLPAATKARALEFRNVSMSFGETPVIRDLSFDLRHGELVVLTGVSGSGKSVLLQLAVGLINPTRDRSSRSHTSDTS